MVPNKLINSYIKNILRYTFEQVACVFGGLNPFEKKIIFIDTKNKFVFILFIYFTHDLNYNVN